MLILRLIHIVLGSVWVGMMAFTTVFLMPAVQETGPDGGKVMAALQRRGLLTIVPILALATLLSGLWLYWRASAGFQPVFLTSRVGLAFGLGGIAALLAYGLGIAIVRPSMLRAAELMQAMNPDTPERARQEALAEAQRLRARAALAGRVVLLLLLAAAAAMAVARYL